MAETRLLLLDVTLVARKVTSEVVSMSSFLARA
jgi:hypothetical protein